MLASEFFAQVLLAVATDARESAKYLVATSEELSDEERSDLWRVLESDADPAERLLRLGDLLRVRGIDRNCVNECYRLAHHIGLSWADGVDNPLYGYFMANRSGTVLDKWPHYFDAYHRHLAQLRGTAPRVLEIGVFNGGGLRLWTWYFGPGTTVVGIDIDDSAKAVVGSRHPVLIGDQQDPEFLRRVVEEYGPFDVVIDDGGHTMEQQITSVSTLFPLLPDTGLYIVEDCHTSYWPDYGGGLRRPGTFVEWVKARIDDLHGYHIPEGDHVDQLWTRSVGGLHVYDSVVVLEKVAPRPAPFAEVTGTLGHPEQQRPESLVQATLVAQQQLASTERKEARERQTEAERETARVRAQAETEVGRIREQAREDVRQARQEMKRLAEEQRQAQRERVQLRESLERTRSELLESYLHTQAMRRTLSWRVTAPLRRVRNPLRKG